MVKRAQGFNDSVESLTLTELVSHASYYVSDCECRLQSPRTIHDKKWLLDKLVWFMRRDGIEIFDTNAIRAFLSYIANGHEDEGGRWGNSHMTRAVRPRTVKNYYIYLHSFCAWLVEERVIDEPPMARIRPPRSQSDQVQPFTDDQVIGLLAAAKRSTCPVRNTAILMLMLDSGLRASEVCNLRLRDLDLQAPCCRVLGKGNKHRTVSFGRKTARAMYNHLKEIDASDDSSFLFMSERGTASGSPLTRSGLLQLMRRLGTAAGVQITRCSPHTCRHTFAIKYLRNGGDVFSLKMQLGHTSLAMTNRYVAMAQADVAAKHRQFSPMDRL